MAHHPENKKKVIGGVILIVGLIVGALALAFPARANDPLAVPPPVAGTAMPSDHNHAPKQRDYEPPAAFTALERLATTCSGGIAGEYACQGIDFMSRVPLSSFGGSPGSASNLWGYVDLDDNREYAVIGMNTGTGVVEVTDPENPRIVGTIPGVTSQWREVKVYQFRNVSANRWDAYAYITTEGTGGGIQIIDLTQLPNSVALAATWNGVSRSHTAQISNIDFSTNVANNPSFPPILYISGSNLGGLRFVSLANPTNLTELGAWTETYSHDTYPHVFTDARANQCAAGHNPCEVVFSFAGTPGLKIIDVTNKSAPVTLSTVTYPQQAYTHSGWISSDSNSLFLHDELDEQNFTLNSTIRTVNITSLTAPSVSISYTGPTRAIDHNGYTIGNKFYFANYTRGIAVLDATNPNAPTQLSYFDTYPTNDNASFAAAWGVYPFLPSGNILISDIQRGLIVVREQSTAPTPTPTITNTPTDTPTPSATPTPTNTPTDTPTPSDTPTPTNTPTNTPTGTPTNTPTSTPTAGNTGFLSPSANAAQTSSAGDNNGFEASAVNAHADGGGVAQDVNSGTNNNASCTANSKDKHRFSNYTISLPGGVAVKGIEVRLDARADAVGSNAPKMCVQLSWDGGTTWTAAKQTATLTTSEATYVLGGAADTWGRTWTAANLSNASFRIRVNDVASGGGATARDFSLDWVAVRVSYQ